MGKKLALEFVNIRSLKYSTDLYIGQQSLYTAGAHVTSSIGSLGSATLWEITHNGINFFTDLSQVQSARLAPIVNQG